MEPQRSHIELEIHTDSDMRETISSDVDSIAVQVSQNLCDPELSRSRRLTIIAGLLEAGLVLTTRQLRHGFAISVRTAYRDIQELKATGLPIQCDKGRYCLNYLKWRSWIQSLSDAWIAGNVNIEKE